MNHSLALFRVQIRFLAGGLVEAVSAIQLQIQGSARRMTAGGNHNLHTVAATLIQVNNGRLLGQ
jgi:hypothetical protein